MFPSSTPILLVDDMKGVRVLLVRLLRQMGFENITEASEGHEAISIIENSDRLGNPIGLVIADMRMPGVDGLQLLQQMKGNPKFNSIPFVMLSAESDKEAIVNAIRSGVDDYIIKPASLNALQSKLEKVYSRHSQKS